MKFTYAYMWTLGGYFPRENDFLVVYIHVLPKQVFDISNSQALTRIFA